MLGKHSHNNRESLEGIIFKLIREAKKLSLKDVADKMNLKVAVICHFENGRKFYKDEDIQDFLKCYEFSMNNFNALREKKNLNKKIVNHFLMNLESGQLNNTHLFQINVDKIK